MAHPTQYDEAVVRLLSIRGLPRFQKMPRAIFCLPAPVPSGHVVQADRGGGELEVGSKWARGQPVVPVVQARGPPITSRR